MSTKFTVSQVGGYSADLDDLLIRREYFSEGTLWTWGNNTSGRLGDGTTTSRSSPGTTAGGGTNWRQVSCGTNHTAAIKTDGTLWTWGTNPRGELGDGTTTARSSPGTTAGAGTNWSQISSGYLHTAAIKTDGTLWTWGANFSGRLGNGNTTSRSSPGTTAGGGVNWRQVSSGDANTAAIKADGTLWTWGLGTGGRLGDGTTTQRTSPGTTAGAGTNWSQVSSGYAHAAAVKTDGTLWLWGANTNGEVGDGTITSRLSPVTTAGGGTDWRQVSCGTTFTAAIKTDGTLWTWGNNPNGVLGDGTTTARSSPGTTAGGGTNWKQVFCGSEVTATPTVLHTAAIKTDGTLWTWGTNSSGQLGTGDTTSRSSPGTTVAAYTNWKNVSVGGRHTGIVTDLTL